MLNPFISPSRKEKKVSQINGHKLELLCRHWLIHVQYIGCLFITVTKIPDRNYWRDRTCFDSVFEGSVQCGRHGRDTQRVLWCSRSQEKGMGILTFFFLHLLFYLGTYFMWWSSPHSRHIFYFSFSSLEKPANIHPEVCLNLPDDSKRSEVDSEDWSYHYGYEHMNMLIWTCTQEQAYIKQTWNPFTSRLIDKEKLEGL